jgi:hypothetical protein
LTSAGSLAGHTVRNTGKRQMVIVYIDGKCRYNLQQQKGIPVRYTGPFRALVGTLGLTKPNETRST